MHRSTYDNLVNWTRILEMHVLVHLWSKLFDWLRYYSVPSVFRCFLVQCYNQSEVLLFEIFIVSQHGLGSRTVVSQRYFNPSRREARSGWKAAPKCTPFGQDVHSAVVKYQHAFLFSTMSHLSLVLQ